MGSVQDNMVLFAHCDPAYPRAWRNEPMRSHLINVSNLGCTVIIVVGRDHYVMTKGRPTVKMTEEQALELSKSKYIKQGSDGKLHIGLLDSTVASTDSRLVPRPVPRADYDYDNKR
jgi:hypothetical protein